MFSNVHKDVGNNKIRHQYSLGSKTSQLYTKKIPKSRLFTTLELEKMKALTRKAMLDDSDFRKKIKDAQQYAKDTWKLLDKKHVLQLEFNKTQADAKVKQLQSLLRNKDLDEAKKIVLSIDLTRAKKEATEANAILNNYLNTGNEKLSRFRSAFASIWSWFLSVGQSIGFGVAALIKTGIDKVADFIKSASDNAINFESAFAGVKKTIEATAWGFQGLKKELKDMATEIPVGFEELSKIAELWGQLWIAKKDLKDFTRVIANLWVSTNLSTEAAATSLARIANVFQLSSKDYEKLWNTIVQLGNNFATTESEIVDFSSYLMASAKTAGFTADEVFAIGSTLSSVAINAEAGWSAFSKVISVINTAVATGNKTIKDFAKVAWLSAEEFAMQWKEKPSEAFTRFVEGLGREGAFAIPIIQDLLGNNVRLQNGMLATANAGSKLREAFAMAHEEYENGNALQTEASKRYETAQSKIAMLDNELENMSETLWKKAIPAMVWWKEVLVDIHSWINNLFGATDVFSEHLGKLTDKITENEEAMKKLSEAYREGKISKEEYLESMQKLWIEKANLKKEYEEEERFLSENEKAMKKIEDRLKSLQEEQAKNSEKLAEAKKNQEELSQKWYAWEEWGNRYSAIVKVLTERINENAEEERKLIEQKAQLEKSNAEREVSNYSLKDTFDLVKDAMKKVNDFRLNESGTRAEFDKTKQAALNSIDAFEKRLSMIWANWGNVVSRYINTQMANFVNKAKWVLAWLQWNGVEKTDGWYKPSNKWYWSKKDPLAKKKEELKKLRDLQIEQIKDSEQSERDKYKSILKVNEDYKKKLAALEWKSNDEIIKQAEDAAKDEERIIKDKYSKINKAIEKSEGNLKDYWKQIQEVKKKRKDALTDMKKQLQDLNHEMKELDQNYTDEQADRWVEVKNQIKNNSRDNSGLDRITQNYDKKTLEQRRDAGQKEINNIDIDKVIEQLNLKEEEAFLEGKITEEKRKQAEENSKLSESQKRDIQYQKDKLILQEKINIAKAFSSQKDFFENKLSIWENSDWSLKASYIDENWEEKQVTDYKNIQYLADLANKQAVMKKEIEDLELKTAEEYKIYETLNQQKADLEKNQTEILQEEIQKRKNEVSSYVDHYEKEANRQLDIAKNLAQQMQSYAAQYVAAKASMWGGGSTTNITNHAGNTVNQTYNINNPSDASAAVFRAATERLIN